MKVLSFISAYFLCICLLYMLWVMVDHVRVFGLTYQAWPLVISLIVDVAILSFIQWLYRKLPHRPKSKPFIWFEKISIWSYLFG